MLVKMEKTGERLKISPKSLQPVGRWPYGADDREKTGEHKRILSRLSADVGQSSVTTEDRRNTDG